MSIDASNFQLKRNTLKGRCEFATSFLSKHHVTRPRVHLPWKERLVELWWLELENEVEKCVHQRELAEAAKREAL
jgi:hypothetical protein